MRAVLEAENYAVTTAENGEDALKAMEREHIDLVVLDVMMPKMDGYEFTKTLRSVQNELPILMVSAKQLPSDKKKGFLAGTDDFMTKPRVFQEAFRPSYPSPANLPETPESSPSAWAQINASRLCGYAPAEPPDFHPLP